MKEFARVLKVRGKFAVVQIEKTVRCEGCKVCAFQNGKSTVKLKALNTAGAKAGDRVVTTACSLPSSSISCPSSLRGRGRRSARWPWAANCGRRFYAWQALPSAFSPYGSSTKEFPACAVSVWKSWR